MTTCLDIVQRALLSAEGEREAPTGPDGALAMMRLQDLILSLPLLLDGAWRDVIAPDGAETWAQDGDRVHAGAQARVTLPHGGEAASGAPPADLGRVQVLGDNAQAGLWIYSASRGRWGRADRLSLADDSPFGPEDDAALAALLAVALAGDGGGQAPADVAALAAAAPGRFSARFYRHSPAAADPAALRLADMGYWR